MKAGFTYKYRLVLIAVGVSYLFWLLVFSLAGNPPTTGTYTDSLSGETVKMAGVSGTADVNPNVPFFVGFNYLKKYGVSIDDRRYILDVLTNYTLYDLQLKSAKISYVNKSFKNTLNKGTATGYTFKVGVNDKNIHTVRVTSDIVEKTIYISLLNTDNKEVFGKEFILYSL